MSRVLVISADPDLRRRWRAVLRAQAALARVQECSHLELAYRRFPVDCCLIDLGGRRAADVRAVGEIIKRNSGVPFVAFSAVPNAIEGLILLKSGAKGYCNRQISRAALTAVLEVVREGGVWAGQQVTQHLLANAFAVAKAPNRLPPSFAGLTERERQVAESVAAGLSNKVIALNAGITERTVKAHLNAVFRKTGMKNRVQLALAISESRNSSDRLAHG